MSDDHNAAPSPTARPAAQDMAAIFGEGPRIATPRTAAPPAPPPARRGGRAGMAALFVGALGVAVAGGVMLGHDAVGPAATSAPAPTLASRSAAPPHATAPAPASVAPAVVAPVSLPPVAEQEVVDATGAEKPAPVVVPPRAAPPAFAQGAPAREVAPAPAAYAPPVRAARMRCFGEVDCLNVRVYETDAEVARAYQAATRAGVPPRMLREYRDEWLRARDLAERRPRETLRIYGMIAADLFDLAEDAAADDRMPRS